MKKRAILILTIGLLMSSYNMAGQAENTALQTIPQTETSALVELTGGWELPDDILLTEEAREAFEKATEGLTGVVYEPLALLGTQVVAGTNYSILCRSTIVYPGAAPAYAILYIYQDLEGNTELLRVQELNLSADESPNTEQCTEAALSPNEGQ